MLLVESLERVHKVHSRVCQVQAAVLNGSVEVLGWGVACCEKLDKLIFRYVRLFPQLLRTRSGNVQGLAVCARVFWRAIRASFRNSMPRSERGKQHIYMHILAETLLKI